VCVFFKNCQHNCWRYIVHVRECVITNATACTLYTVHVSSCFVQKIEIKSLLTQLHEFQFVPKGYDCTRNQQSETKKKLPEAQTLHLFVFIRCLVEMYMFNVCAVLPIVITNF
jgi:hypothetical protein